MMHDLFIIYYIFVLVKYKALKQCIVSFQDFHTSVLNDKWMIGVWKSNPEISHWLDYVKGSISYYFICTSYQFFWSQQIHSLIAPHSYMNWTLFPQYVLARKNMPILVASICHILLFCISESATPASDTVIAVVIGGPGSHPRDAVISSNPSQYFKSKSCVLHSAQQCPDLWL